MFMVEKDMHVSFYTTQKEKKGKEKKECGPVQNVFVNQTKEYKTLSFYKMPIFQQPNQPSSSGQKLKQPKPLQHVYIVMLKTAAELSVKRPE